MGDSYPSITIPYMVDLFKQGKLEILKDIIKEYNPEDMNQAVEDSLKGVTLKPVIDWEKV
ncbi:hypothetical protein IE53DRAFT_382821 [Violaceomyces palustris]|uniref:Uncharacterized protein n=1 Tax=Violaceomyces palustris TaxID=1673888 RepID=A0ACD0NL61_9BASI|nr:hypothetical protein IE53DRAFT_382821 [Violaceomyces palustris]